MTLPRTEWLRGFVCFCEHLNFTHAASKLHITQPALHGQIKRLTAAVGRPLYTRDGRALALTPTGVQTLRFAREQLRRAEAFVARAQGQEPHRPLTLAAGEGALLYLLGGGISRATRRADTRLRLLPRDSPATLAAVRSGEADLGVAVLTRAPADLTTDTLRVVPQMLAMPNGHPLSRRRTVPLSALDGRPLVVPPPDRPHRLAVEQAMSASDAALEVAVEASGWELMLHFVKLRIGLAIVNGSVRLPRGLCAVPVTGLPAIRYSMLHHPDRDDAALGRLREDLRSGLPAAPGSPR